MNRILIWGAALLLGGVGHTLGWEQTAMSDELKVGATAPEFSLKGSDGKTYKLSQFKGKQFVVVAWYPKALTGG